MITKSEKMQIFSKIKIIIYLQIFNLIYPEECDKLTPILKNGNCVAEYCTQTEFETNICKINNKIAETQWLNNIFYAGNNDHRYVNFASDLDGNLFWESSSIPKTAERIFYGIDINGDPFFTNDSKEKIFLRIANIVREDVQRYESQNGIIIIKIRRTI